MTQTAVDSAPAPLHVFAHRSAAFQHLEPMTLPGRTATASPPSVSSSSPAARPRHLMRDLTKRLLGVPMFGFVIPRLAGLLEGLTVRDAAYWVGTCWFFLVSFTLWQGSRTLHFHLRQRIAFMQRPALKIVSLIATNVVYTIPVSIAMFSAWYFFSPQPGVDWPAVARATVFSAVAVVLVSHAYETVYLIHDRRAESLRVAMAERARLQAELDSLKGQLAPHFLFNCLNTLSVLIAEEPATARKFNLHLANLCRYLLKHQDHNLVPLADELVFFKDYVELVRLRYGSSVQINLPELTPATDLKLPPASLQLLLENALKHNAATPAKPLVFDVQLDGDRLLVTNSRQAPAEACASIGIGLRNLRERFALVAQSEIAIERNENQFRVILPLVR